MMRLQVHSEKRILAWIVLAMMLVTVLSPPVSAKNARMQKRIRVGYYEAEYFQYGMSDEAVKSGYGYEYLQQVSYYTGWKYQYVYGDFDTLYEMLQRGEIDLLAGVRYQQERTAQVEYPARKMITYQDADYYLCTAKAQEELLEELNAALDMIHTNNPMFLDSLYQKYYAMVEQDKELTAAERVWLNTHTTLRIGYLNDYLPYCDTAEDGQATGIVRDVAAYMISGMGLGDTLKITYTGYDTDQEMVAALHADEIDAAFPSGGTAAYAEQAQVSQTACVIEAGSDMVFKGSYSEKKEAVIAVNEKNEMQRSYTITNYPNARILYCESLEACLDAVIDGRADSTIVNSLRSTAVLNSVKYQSLHSIQLSKADERCFVVAAGESALLTLLNRGIELIGPEYGIHASYRYMGELYTYTIWDLISDHLIAVTIGVAGLLVLIVTVSVHRLERMKKQALLEEERKQELTKALTLAHEANQAKTNFLTDISHDIRTPMNAIIGFTSLAQTHIDNKAQVQDYLSKIMTSGNHLLSLMNDILDMGRIESGRMRLNETACHLPTLMQELDSMLQPEIANRQLQFHIDMAEVTDMDIRCDKLRLHQVLLNCISNAIKFTKPGGAVSVEVRQKPGAETGYADFTFIIRDTGIGMAPEFVEHVFESFAREENSTVSGIPGTGLGMSITKKIVDIMQGSIRVDSKKNVGTKITICLSFCLEPDIGRKEPEDAGETPDSQEVTCDFTGKTILLVEDNALNMEIAAEIIGQTGASIETAQNGVQALEKISSAPEQYYDMIFMDVQMPEMDGYEATRQIRAQKRADVATLPIIAMTANAFEADRRQALAAGMNAHTSKPVDSKQIYSIMTRYLQDTQTEER